MNSYLSFRKYTPSIKAELPTTLYSRKPMLRKRSI